MTVNRPSRFLKRFFLHILLRCWCSTATSSNLLVPAHIIKLSSVDKMKIHPPQISFKCSEIATSYNWSKRSRIKREFMPKNYFENYPKFSIHRANTWPNTNQAQKQIWVTQPKLPGVKSIEFYWMIKPAIKLKLARYQWPERAQLWRYKPRPNTSD